MQKVAGISFHFPNSLCEVVANIILGKVDGVEICDFYAPTLNTYSVTEWYRLLNLGHRLAAVDRIDKIPAGMSVAGVSTYAQIGDQEFVFKNWGKAVHAGKAFATSGSIPGLSVEGQPLGAQIHLPTGGGYLEAKTRTNSIQSFHELRGVFNGEAVVWEASGTGSQSIALYTNSSLDQSNWVPAQGSSQYRVWHIWLGIMAAHTSPNYIQVDGNELFSPSDAMHMKTLLEGGLTWLDTLSIPVDPSMQAKVSNVKLAQKSYMTDNITILNIV